MSVLRSLFAAIVSLIGALGCLFESLGPSGLKRISSLFDITFHENYISNICSVLLNSLLIAIVLLRFVYIVFCRITWEEHDGRSLVFVARISFGCPRDDISSCQPSSGDAGEMLRRCSKDALEMLRGCSITPYECPNKLTVLELIWA